jgi:hypothetical protein
MNDDALNQLRRANPVPQTMPALPIATVLRRLNDEPVARMHHRPGARRGAHRLVSAVPITVSAVLVTAVVGVMFWAGGRDQTRSPAATATVPGRQHASAAQPNHFATNANGETYGSSANTTPADEPDLISASGKNAAGNIVYGYVRKTDLDSASGANVTTPAQAAAYDAWSRTAGPIRIPLYAVNGTTVIGSFTITPP